MAEEPKGMVVRFPTERCRPTDKLHRPILGWAQEGLELAVEHMKDRIWAEIGKVNLAVSVTAFVYNVQVDSDQLVSRLSEHRMTQLEFEWKQKPDNKQQ